MALVGQNANVGTGGFNPKADNEEIKHKAAKKAAADRHVAKVREERQKDHESMLVVRDFLKEKGIFDQLPQEQKDYILAKCVPPAQRIGHTGPSFFSQVFGDNPAVGAEVTLKDVITKTYKGMDTLNSYIKKWAQKGITVSVEVNKADMLSTKYKLEKIELKTA
jgi:hypothetical protein